MTMDSGTRNVASEINVTPMIDILLVLLIIFMVIVPAIPRGEAALMPRPPIHGGGSDAAVVLEVVKGAAGSTNFRVNQQVVERRDLPAKLAAIYANRAERVLFIRGDDQLSFNEIATVIDIGHAAGADQIGLMTPKLTAREAGY
jgi:biopolymer transport protein ExbD